MSTTDAQVRKLMVEMREHGQLGRAALRAGMDRKTARKYVQLGQLPSECRQPRSWRTREDPFEEIWPEVAARLADAPELEAKALFTYFAEAHEGFHEGQLRTFQRRVRQWRARLGPDKEVFFPQTHRPGEFAQTDFTCANSLGVTICGEPLEHLLCQFVLTYSNWQWATVCFSESLASLRRGIQSAVFRLGCVPEQHQTDNSTAATHDLRNGKREFNADYQGLMDHFGMKPRTIAVGESNQNGDVEALNNSLKRRLEQHLLLRGSRDFESIAAYEGWVQSVLERSNALRGKRLGEELSVMRQLRVERLPEHEHLQVVVTSWSTIRVKRNTYSVPSRLRRERLHVRLHADRLEVYHGDSHQLTIERLRGEGGHRINYRHIISSLVKKPGAFPRYRYREELFPSLTFRRAYDALTERLSPWKADVEYLRVLHLAARTMESEVESALELLLADRVAPLSDTVKAIVDPITPEVPSMAVPVVQLATYDELLGETEEVSA